MLNTSLKFCLMYGKIKNKFDILTHQKYNYSIFLSFKTVFFFSLNRFYVHIYKIGVLNKILFFLYICI